MKNFSIGILILALLFSAGTAAAQRSAPKTDKLVIYQLLPRLFGNKNTSNIPYGTIEQNGCGKFNDINEQALNSLKELSIDYIWYTGVIAHATLTDYTAFGIKKDDADVVKGRAGSPYAIRDYYDVDPDLAVNVKERMQEFEALIARTHAKKLRVLIDFVPNHVARSYHSYARPEGVVDFGSGDDPAKAFDPKNDFYYIPGKPFIVPSGIAPATPLSPLEDGKFAESPAKATGNNVFSAQPSVNDWYETVKLNYGIDLQHGAKQYFDPVPPVWIKMRDILVYWTNKGVDGFRCDVAEMVPVAFWKWVIPEVKKVNPDLIFIGEAYDPSVYSKYLVEGKFDYLYDKVGLYDGLKKLIRNEAGADVQAIQNVWQKESAGFGNKMLRFLENHDEERIASQGFAGNPALAIPAMVVTATLGSGPVMLYFGQEVGEPAKGAEGFGGEDNRTTIFDYWGVPHHQQWMAGGKFNGEGLSSELKELRNMYANILRITKFNRALRDGTTVEALPAGNMNNKMYAYFRYKEQGVLDDGKSAALKFTPVQRALVVVNFDRAAILEATITVPEYVLSGKPFGAPFDLLNNKKISSPAANSIKIVVAPGTAQIIDF